MQRNMDKLSLFLTVLFFWETVSSASNDYNIDLKTISFDNYGAKCSVTYTTDRGGYVPSMWFVDDVPILYNDPDWFVEERTYSPFSSTLQSRSSSVNARDKAIHVNFYSSICKTTIDFGRKRTYRDIDYQVSSETNLPYLNTFENRRDGAIVFTTLTNIDVNKTKLQPLKLQKSLQWEIIISSQRSVRSYKQTLPLQYGKSSVTWKYFGPIALSTFGRLRFSVTTKAEMNRPSIAITYVRDVKLQTSQYSYSTFPVSYLSDQIFCKNINDNTRLCQCYIVEDDDISPNQSYMYLKSNSSTVLTDLRFSTYGYASYGYQTELYSIARDPTLMEGEAYCKAGADRLPGHKITAKAD